MDAQGRLSVGIVGFGRIGAEHARWLATCQGIRAVAVVDATEARRELARERGLVAHESLDAILKDESIDVVLVSTATAMHHEHSLLALRAGKHVMVEKPMALDLKQSREIVELAEKLGRVLTVFQCRRWDIDYLTLKSAIESGVLGKLINVESRIGQFASCVGPAAKEWRPGWRNEAQFGGGGLYDWGSHLIDQMWQLMLPAKPVRVFAQLRGNVWTSDCDDFARVLVDFDNGSVGLVEINTTTARPLPRWHVDGTKGTAESPFSLQFDLETWADFRFADSTGAEQPSIAKTQAAVVSESAIWERFGAAIRGRGEVAVSARSVLTTMALLDAARESSAKGCAVEVTWIPDRQEKP